MERSEEAVDTAEFGGGWLETVGSASSTSSGIFAFVSATFVDCFFGCSLGGALAGFTAGGFSGSLSGSDGFGPRSLLQSGFEVTTWRRESFTTDAADFGAALGRGDCSDATGWVLSGGAAGVAM